MGGWWSASVSLKLRADFCLTPQRWERSGVETYGSVRVCRMNARKCRAGVARGRVYRRFLPRGSYTHCILQHACRGNVHHIHTHTHISTLRVRHLLCCCSGLRQTGRVPASNDEIRSTLMRE